MNKQEKIMQHLANSEVARNCHKKGYIDFVCDNYCKNRVERAIIRIVLQRAITGSSYARQVAHIQNTLGLYLPSKKVKAIRDKKAIKIRQELSQNNLFTSISRWFNKQ